MADITDGKKIGGPGMTIEVIFFFDAIASVGFPMSVRDIVV